MNNKGPAIIKIGLSVLVLSFLIYQIYSMVYKPISTSTAVYYETYSGIDINGYFLKEETLIDYDVTGNERFIVSEGEKVSKGGTIAEVYPSVEMATAYEKIDKISEQIDILESINSVTDPSSVDLDTLTNRINKSYVELMKSADTGKFDTLNEKLSSLLSHLNRKQIITGEVSGFDNLLSSLKTELATLKSTTASPTSKISAEKSGFFVSQTDGLERILSINSVDKIDENIFEKIDSAKASSGFGKIVSSQKFYIIAKMDGDDYLRFSEGDSLKLKTSIPGCEELKTTVYKNKVSPTENSAIMILSCSTMNGQIALTRSASLSIVTEEFSGIRVSNNAVRVVDGVTGVYIMQGSIVKFRPIEIVYSTDTFSVCKQTSNNSSDSIRLYDEVIEKGKNLYDGKYIKWVKRRTTQKNIWW